MTIHGSPRRASRGTSTVVLTVLALLSLAGLRSADAAFGPRHQLVAPRRLPLARMAKRAYGRSGGVRMHFALPNDRVDLPLEVYGPPAALQYSWIPVGGLSPAEPPRPLSEALRAPEQSGYYRLALDESGERRVLDGVTLAVLVPFASKRGVSLNGYRIGYYRGERRGRSTESPDGFLEVNEAVSDLQVTDHLRISDFLTHDDQTQWPRYAALDARLLDKLELVFAQIAGWHSHGDSAEVAVDVHSGFRTPLHNRQVPRAAGDSRHQYGDAADIAIDANRDGRVDWRDVRLIGLAVETVEREHPELVGGLGLYTRNGSPYAHVDVRGTRARWRG
jgi:Bacterial protein of unknown function (DUF882)